MKKLFVAVLLSTALFAQSAPLVQASLSTHLCNVGDTVIMEVRVTGASESPEEPDIPDIPGLSFESAGSSSNFANINGVSSSSNSYTYVVTPIRAGNYRVPAISVQVGSQTYSSQPMHLSVGTNPPKPPGTTQPRPVFPGSPQTSPWGGPQTPPWGGPPTPPSGVPSLPMQAPVDNSEPVMVEGEISNTRPYVNEMVVYTFRFLHRVRLDGRPTIEPPAATGFLREELGQNTLTVERNGHTYAATEVRTAFFPTVSGKTTIGSTRLVCAMDMSSISNPAWMFQDPVRELTTQVLSIEVLPLPAEGKPPSFQGAVGRQFRLSAELPKNRVKTGEGTRLKIRVEGDAHPDLMPEPSLPSWKSLRSYAPESPAPEIQKEPFRSVRNFSYPLVAQRAGTTKLEPILYSYFDPGQRRYVTLKADPLELTAEGEAQPGETQAAADERDDSSQTLADPLTGWDSSARWPLWNGMLALTLLPWLGSAALLAGLATRDHLHAQSQTHEARLRRAIARVKRSKNLEELTALAYESLEIRHGRSLQGLPLRQLADILPEALVQQLQAVDDSRYAPGATSNEQLLENLRKALLAELQS